MIDADFIVRNVGAMATLAGPAPRTGAAMREVGLLASAALAAKGGRIVWPLTKCVVALTDSFIAPPAANCR